MAKGVPQLAQAEKAPTPISLLERIRANDQDAWRRVLELYQPLVRYWCVRSGLAAEDINDLTQEVFAAAAQGLPGFRRDRPGDTFRGWLRGIARNQILLLRRRGLGKPLAEGGSDALWNFHQIPDPIPASDADSLEMGQVWRQVLEHVRGEFEDNTWRAFWLTVIEGRAPAALTGELQMSVAAIRQAKSRILRRIKAEVGNLVD
jgi:RNA polymerase sigma-70 factor, ECF subfamily